MHIFYTCFVVHAREGFAAFHVVWMLLFLPILSENGCGLYWKLILFAWHPIRWGPIFTYCLFKILNVQILTQTDHFWRNPIKSFFFGSCWYVRKHQGTLRHEHGSLYDFLTHKATLSFRLFACWEIKCAVLMPSTHRRILYL